MTLKSPIKFGKYKDYTVQMYLDMNWHLQLISMYYKLGKIDFNLEVKEILGIENHQIEKPGKDLDKYYLVINYLGYESQTSKRRKSKQGRIDRYGHNRDGILNVKTPLKSKSFLKSKNQGN